MTLLIEGLTARLPDEPQAIEEFLSEHTFPLSQGRTTTFVYQGPADEVNLRHGIFGLPSTQPLHQVEGTDFWYLVFESYIPRR